MKLILGSNENLHLSLETAQPLYPKDVVISKLPVVDYKHSWLFSVLRRERVRVFTDRNIRHSIIVLGDQDINLKQWKLEFDSKDLS